ncbi:DinB family protein [Bacillus sp. BHET2]|uniref:DinB family protein n=1 Tax=Bacillus sp. BHET2 TaxID=2583818 RepID=UPI00110E43EE|nr:DinB family protein [Bacillus sp. BHET2]TMU87161.1 DinB family protein [Bacillus sp. BHET2]
MMVQKDEVVKHHVNMIAWSQTLNNLSSNQWFSPIKENKWSIAEIISHLIPWDEFVLEYRIPYFSSNDSLPNSPDRDAVNERAALEGRSAEKSVTINRFIASRTKLLECIENISSDLWDKTFRIGETELTVYQYFKGLTEHDTHHKKQIQDSLTKH